MNTTTKRPETAEEKEARIFNHYKQRLTSEGVNEHRQIRYIVVEYLCKFPKIDPVKMGAALMLDGSKIEFDDSTITARENAQKRRRVERAAGLYSTKEA